MTTVCNDKGFFTEKRRFGLHDEPYTDADGVSIYRYKYDRFNNLVEESYFDTQDKPVNNIAGIARYIYTYDSFGNQQEKKAYNTAGDEVPLPDESEE